MLLSYKFHSLGFWIWPGLRSLRHFSPSPDFWVFWTVNKCFFLRSRAPFFRYLTTHWTISSCYECRPPHASEVEGCPNARSSTTCEGLFDLGVCVFESLSPIVSYLLRHQVVQELRTRCLLSQLWMEINWLGSSCLRELDSGDSSC